MRAMGESLTPLRPPESFKTARLLLRPVTVADASSVFHGYATDVKATRFMNWPRHRALTDSESFVQRCAQCWRDDSAFPWAVLLAETGEFAGTIELRIRPPRRTSAISCAARTGGAGLRAK